MIQINPTVCVSCGACVNDCFPHALAMEGGGPVLAAPESCIGCGHCIAVCPVAAVSDTELDMGEVKTPTQPAVSPAALLEAMTFRRSCRHFKAQPVVDDVIAMLLEAGRRCPTAKNLQGTSYLVVRDRVADLRRDALHALGDAGRDMLENGCPPDMVRRAQNFLAWEQQVQADPDFDPLFFHAPLLILLVSDADGTRDAAAAAAYMELLAHTLGLGCLYSGYFCAAAAGDDRIRDRLALPEGRQVARCLVLGWPDIKFRRSVPRKALQVRYL
jgi:nitroreductase/NAD-dependent dihydropyrimidine dehydrogenase PreA subunit